MFQPGLGANTGPSGSIRPWQFDRDFNTKPAAASGLFHTGNMAVMALQEELIAMERRAAFEQEKAREEGYAAGYAAAGSAQQNAVLAAVDALQAALEDAESWREEREQVLSGDAAELALAAADFLAGTATGLAPARAIEDALTKVMLDIPRGEEVRVQVHPELVATLQSHVDHLQSKDRRKLAIAVIADPDLAKGDAHFDWQDGGLQLDARRRRDAIVAELQALLSRGEEQGRNDAV